MNFVYVNHDLLILDYKFIKSINMYKSDIITTKFTFNLIIKNQSQSQFKKLNHFIFRKDITTYHYIINKRFIVR